MGCAELTLKGVLVGLLLVRVRTGVFCYCFSWLELLNKRKNDRRQEKEGMGSALTCSKVMVKNSASEDKLPMNESSALADGDRDTETAQ